MNTNIFKSIFLLAVALVVSSTVFAQKATTCINLQTKEVYTPQIDTVFDLKKDYVPYMKVFLPPKEKATGRAVVIFPGGAYAMVALGHEGTSWARYFNELGIAVIAVKYRMPFGNYKIPFGDAEAAIQITKDNAAAWNINPKDIGIMGFSAGGHLASTMVTQSTIIKPAFQILFYPVITMDKSYTHLGSHDNLLGKNASKSLEEKFSNEKHVTKDAPPAFITLAADDQVVPPANGINYFQALVNNKVFATLHVYPTGNHGWGYTNRYKYHKTILSELTLWLEQIHP